MALPQNPDDSKSSGSFQAPPAQPPDPPRGRQPTTGGELREVRQPFSRGLELAAGTARGAINSQGGPSNRVHVALERTNVMQKARHVQEAKVRDKLGAAATSYFPNTQEALNRALAKWSSAISVDVPMALDHAVREGKIDAVHAANIRAALGTLDPAQVMSALGLDMVQLSIIDQADLVSKLTQAALRGLLDPIGVARTSYPISHRDFRQPVEGSSTREPLPIPTIYSRVGEGVVKDGAGSLGPAVPASTTAGGGGGGGCFYDPRTNTFICPPKRR